METKPFCLKYFITLLVLSILCSPRLFAQEPSSWTKYEGNPVLGGDLGVCFDVCLIQEAGLFKMWFSWRTKESIGYTESQDGVHWTAPQIVLAPSDTGWEERINRCSVVHLGDVYYMWYTGQTATQSRIGFATSRDGIAWDRQSTEPVLEPEEEWENVAVMCPDAHWDETRRLFQMYYSAGDQYEPNAIGYATSPDGIHWTKHNANPIFSADPKSKWEQHKVTACQIVKHKAWTYMFYIGFETEDLARIGIARSQDGLTNWERMPNNPIVSPDQDQWDASACYKPFVIFDEKEDLWRLWYNGRNGGVEQIGLALHQGEELGF